MPVRFVWITYYYDLKVKNKKEEKQEPNRAKCDAGRGLRSTFLRTVYIHSGMLQSFIYHILLQYQLFFYTMLIWAS